MPIRRARKSATSSTTSSRIKNIVMSIAEQEELLEDICNDVLGFGPLEPLACARRHLRHHGQRLRHGLHRSPRQGPEDRHPLPRQPAAAEHLPAHRQPGRPPRRRSLSRSATRACPTAPASTSSRRRSPSTGRAHHPQVQEGQADARSARQVRHHHAAGRRDPADHRPLPLQHAGLRRHRLGQDHAAQLPHPLHRSRRAHHHLRGRRRAATAAAACGAPRNPPAQSRRRGRGHHARPGEELPAHAARAHHRRRSARTRGVRPAAGDEHRP